MLDESALTNPTLPAHIVTSDELTQLATTRVNNTPINPDITNPVRERILWLIGPGDNAKRKSYIKNKLQTIAPHLIPYIQFVEVNTRAYQIFVPKPKTKSTHMVAEDYVSVLQAQLSHLLPTTRCIILNDFSVLAATLASTTGHGTKKTLSVFRGSTYVNSLWSGIPAYVLEDASKNYGWRPPSSSTQEHTQIQDIQFFEYDLHRIAALHANPTSAVDEFDARFNIVNSTFSISRPDGNSYTDHGSNEAEFLEWLNRQSLLALDFETARGHITALSVTGISNNDISTITTWVIPQANPTTRDGSTPNPANLHMTPGAFYNLLRAVFQHPCPKIWHNGNYDLQYQLAYSNMGQTPAPITGTQHDTMLLWHAFRSQMPQSLATLASIFIPSYYYWKDEIKGSADSKDRELTGSPVPLDRAGFITYLRYAGLDTWNTMLAWYAMVVQHGLLSHTPTLTNYFKELTLLRGPLLETNMLGCELDRKQLHTLVDEYRTQATTAAANLEIASAGYVPASEATPANISNWIYNVLAARPEKSDLKRIASAQRAGKRPPPPSTNFKLLSLVGEQHPLLEYAVDLTRALGKPTKLQSMYSNLAYPYSANTMRSRLRTNYSFRPYTGRLSSTGSAFWDGTNVQNIPAASRKFCVASPGHILIDIDYSQADSYHFAVACGDKTMLTNVFSPDDTHSRHVEMIFRVPYDEVIAGKKANDPRIVDPITGLRQIIKKLCHGGNYGMMGESAYANAGREALIAAAKLLDISTAGWTRDDFYKFIDYLLVPYFEGYATMLPWRDAITQECIRNQGWVTCYGGHSCFFPEWDKPKERASLTRALLAFYGQGGTGAMVNRAMHRLYYGTWNDEAQLVEYRYGAPSLMQQFAARVIFQTHDSFTFELPLRNLTPNALNAILTAMELECHFNDMDYVVPCEAEIGYRWSKDMVSAGRYSTQSDLLYAMLDRYTAEHPKFQ